MEKKMRKIVIFDTTLRDGEQSPGASMNIREKLEVAHQLKKMQVDVIEAGFPASSPGDFDAVKAVADEMQKIGGPVVAGLARALEHDIKKCAEAVGKNGRVHTFIATSPIHMEKKLKRSPEQILKIATDMVSYAKTFTEDVEFSCEDAGRTDWNFLAEMVEAVILAGAKTVNIPDTVGYCTPWQFGECIKFLHEKVSNIKNAIISVHCHNDLGMSVANSLAAVVNGAGQVECTINGLGERAGNASLEEIIMNLNVRKDFYNVETNINTKEIFKTSKLVSQITGIKVQRNKAIVGANAFAHEAGIHQDGVLKERTTYEIMRPEDVGWTGESMVMGKHSGKHAFKKRLEELGFTTLSEEDLMKAFERFKILCDQKKVVFDEDLISIMQDEIFKSEKIYELDYFHCSAGTQTIPTATVRLKKGKEIMLDSATGDGPIDAAYNTIERISGIETRLMEYNLDALTSGKDAIGRVNVLVKHGEYTVRGHGSDTDVVIASVKAFLSAINSIAIAKKLKEEPRPKGI